MRSEPEASPEANGQGRWDCAPSKTEPWKDGGRGGDQDGPGRVRPGWRRRWRWPGEDKPRAVESEVPATATELAAVSTTAPETPPFGRPGKGRLHCLM